MKRSSTGPRFGKALAMVIAASAAMRPLTAPAAEYEAMLDWNRKAKLSTLVTGVVGKVTVRPGDRVRVGDVLLQLEDRVLKANVEKAKADVQHYDRLYKEAERELERNQELYDRTVLSDHELEMAHIAFDQATAQLKTAEAQLAKMESDLRYSEIKAPFDGVVTVRNANEGEIIVSSETPPVLIELAETDVMIAEFQVSGGQLGGFNMGGKATVVVGGVKYKGEVSAVGFEPVSKASNKYVINVRLYTEGKLLRAGRPAKVILP